MRLAIAAVRVAVVGLAVVCVASWIPVWPCTLFEHFRVQYVACGLLAIGGAAALRVGGYFDLAVVIALINGLPVVADLGARGREALEGTPVRVLFLNVHTESSGFARVRQLIADERPDVIGLAEVDQRWLDAIAPAIAGYPGRLELPRADNFGIALYARGELAITPLETPLPSIAASVQLRDTTRLAVVVTHPLPPISGAALAQQFAQFEQLATHVNRQREPVVLMGDLNATPWSCAFQQLRQSTGLCDSRAGFGIQASFPAGSWVRRIPIDHVLVSCSIGVRERRIGDDVGSDHLPVISDLVIPR